MKTLKILTLAFMAIGCIGQERYVSLTINMTKRTNSVEIVEGETAHVISVSPGRLPNGVIRGEAPSVYAEKDGEYVLLGNGVGPSGTPIPYIGFFPTPPAVAGPAKLIVIGYGGLATFRITPNFNDPQKTAIVLPGPENAAIVAMQCSTNLVDWLPATNGVYSGDVAKFFRIHLEKAKP